MKRNLNFTNLGPLSLPTKALIVSLDHSLHVLQLQGTTVNGSQQYKLNCCLSSFQSDANSFCTALSGHLKDAHQFATELAKASNVVHDEGSPSLFSRKRACGMYFVCFCQTTIC